MKGAESTEHGYLLHLNRDTSPPQRRSCTSTPLFRYQSAGPILTKSGQISGAKQEVEIVALHIPPEWKRLTGMDMSEEGQDMAG